MTKEERIKEIYDEIEAAMDGIIHKAWPMNPDGFPRTLISADDVRPIFRAACAFSMQIVVRELKKDFL